MERRRKNEKERKQKGGESRKKMPKKKEKRKKKLKVKKIEMKVKKEDKEKYEKRDDKEAEESLLFKMGLQKIAQRCNCRSICRKNKILKKKMKNEKEEEEEEARPKISKRNKVIDVKKNTKDDLTDICIEISSNDEGQGQNEELIKEIIGAITRNEQGSKDANKQENKKKNTKNNDAFKGAAKGETRKIFRRMNKVQSNVTYDDYNPNRGSRMGVGDGSWLRYELGGWMGEDGEEDAWNEEDYAEWVEKGATEWEIEKKIREKKTARVLEMKKKMLVREMKDLDQMISHLHHTPSLSSSPIWNKIKN